MKANGGSLILRDFIPVLPMDKQDQVIVFGAYSLRVAAKETGTSIFSELKTPEQRRENQESIARRRAEEEPEERRRKIAADSMKKRADSSSSSGSRPISEYSGLVPFSSSSEKREMPQISAADAKKPRRSSEDESMDVEMPPSAKEEEEHEEEEEVEVIVEQGRNDHQRMMAVLPLCFLTALFPTLTGPLKHDFFNINSRRIVLPASLYSMCENLGRTLAQSIHTDNLPESAKLMSIKAPLPPQRKRGMSKEELEALKATRQIFKKALLEELDRIWEQSGRHIFSFLLNLDESNTLFDCIPHSTALTHGPGGHGKYAGIDARMSLTQYTIPPRAIGIFAGDLMHRGSEYFHRNVRLHGYVLHDLIHMPEDSVTPWLKDVLQPMANLGAFDVLTKKMLGLKLAPEDDGYNSDDDHQDEEEM